VILRKVDVDVQMRVQDAEDFAPDGRETTGSAASPSRARVGSARPWSSMLSGWEAKCEGNST
jgi:hypothetical protein